MGEQLRLRVATPADKEALAAFNVAVHARPDTPTSSQYLDRYTRDLFERPHPLIAVGDHLLIEEAETGAIGSTTGGGGSCRCAPPGRSPAHPRPMWRNCGA